MVEVWTDGAYSKGSIPKGWAPIGGWAWAIENGPEDCGSETGPQVTSQRMEMRAALQAALTVPDDDICIVSDSAYVVNCFEERWWDKWEANGWRTTLKKPVANRDLWELLIDVVEFRGITFRHVRGHSGEPMNEYVDKLAVKAKLELVSATR